MRRFITINFEIEADEGFFYQCEADISVELEHEIEGMDLDRNRGISIDTIEDVDIVEVRIIGSQFPQSILNGIENTVREYEFDV